ncbi:uncharacterized protein OCT59_009643 [Rhizophagus irregularis]|uniref:F-box domain-containing protein n=1 Tax=Rhizophagus irregularis (strain DAOM 197198w) TaxID=1432141 RepID=A0A015JZQ9_RHIIW|nr:hypothetical protein RirG_065400 [Rhizophagus irregularis DAOM 197198w]UZO18327.1 hypothetical protein OCT59_009643 [Rhizophagus irregularis]GBC25204.1 hypothetical protein GLOIN_2v1784405 [Rhizophagus irregularis DAOM 181602=DAOM 197198]
MSQLLADCINDILGYLDRDKITLRSCLLVNRLWCNISVKILWSNVWNYDSSNYSTLIACLPDESKEILNINGIIISPPTSKPPMFNYASFCKVLSDYHIKCGIERLLKNKSISPKDLTVKTVAQEIYKLLMNQISSLKTLHIDPLSMNIIFTSYPGSQESLKYLSELCCRSNVYSEFFHQLSQICYNIKAICVVIDHHISDGLMNLILSQNKLKNLIFHQSHDREVLKSIIPLLEKLSDNTSVKLGVYEIKNFIPLPFPKNLRELLLASNNGNFTEDTFKELQRVIFPNLQVLIFSYLVPKIEHFNNFLERNGENLRKLYLEDCTKALDLNLSISKFCPNLVVLSTSVSGYDDLKVIFVNCQHLESIKLIDQKMDMKELFNVIVNYSPKNFFKLIHHYDHQMELQLLPEVLEWFFMSWSNREQQKPFSLIIIDFLKSSKIMKDHEKKKIIENYIKLGVIRKFRFVVYNEDY